jgi:hypothetical protein
MYSTLPKNEKTFYLTYVGAVTGIKYEGQFTVRCVLDLRSKHLLELEKTRLQADHSNPTNGLAGIAFTVANVRARIITAPQWWTDLESGMAIMDEDLIVELYERCIMAETEWRDSIKKRAEGVAVEVADPANPTKA